MLNEIVVIMNFGSKDGEKALEIAKRACTRALREYGLKVLVVPIVAWRDINARDPIVMVNGRIVSSGRVPNENELIEALTNPPRPNEEIRPLIELPAALVTDDDTMYSAAECA